MGTREILGATPFFAEVLDDTGLDLLSSNVNCITFERGETIFREGDTGSNMYVIARGSVTVSIKLPEGEHITATINAGDLVGEMSLLTGTRRAATVTTATSVELIEIGEVAIRLLLGTKPDLIDRFALILQKRRMELEWIYSSVNWEHYKLPSADMASLIRRQFPQSPDKGPS